MKNHNILENYIDKYIAFIDILGFKNLVKTTENESDRGLPWLLSVVKIMKYDNFIEGLNEYGPSVCPQSYHDAKNLNFQITQISDCVIISVEKTSCALINLFHYCRIISFRLLKEGLLCRGFITSGNIFHDGNQVVGSGYINAYTGEGQVRIFQTDTADVGTPFIEIEKSLLQGDFDVCLKDTLKKLVISDGDLYAISTFSVLDPEMFLSNPGSTKEKDTESINIVRDNILMIKSKIESFSEDSDPKASAKRAHYIRMLDKQIRICEEAQIYVDRMHAPLISLKIRDIMRNPDNFRRNENN